MRIGRSFKVVSILIIVLVIFSMTSGVYASWNYSTFTAPTSTNNQLSVSIDWKTFNAFPNNPEGQAHKTIINNIATGSNGLNNPNSFLNKEITKRENNGKDYYGSMDNSSGKEAKNNFDTDNSGINFIVHSPTSTPNIKYVYSTKEDLGATGGFLYASSPNVPAGEFIYIIYRSTLKLNSSTNQWETLATEIGYAPERDYQNTTWNPFAKKQPAFDFTQWKAGKLGLDTQHAVYSFAGQHTTAILDNPTDKIYYKYTPTSAGNKVVTITEANANCKVKVYNSSMQLVNANSGAQNSKKVGWNAKANTLYYIEVTGHISIAFNIT